MTAHKFPSCYLVNLVWLSVREYIGAVSTVYGYSAPGKTVRSALSDRVTRTAVYLLI